MKFYHPRRGSLRIGDDGDAICVIVVAMLQDPTLDPALLQYGDSRNVRDDYRTWTVESIRRDLDGNRNCLEIAIENLERDFNMGTIVRTANAFNIAKIHIIGRRQWNRRGAMMTDAYMHVVHHASVSDFTAEVGGKQIIGIDIIPGSVAISETEFSRDAVLVFGSESAGISEDMLSVCSQVAHIEQFGSTRSINVGVAAGIAMYTWMQRYVL